MLKICAYFTLINLHKAVRCKLFYTMFSCTGTYNHLIKMYHLNQNYNILLIPPPPMQPSQYLGVSGISVRIPHSLSQKAIQMPFPSLIQF